MAQFLLIHCPDEPGLVYKITGVLFRHGLSILRNGEFVERENSQFFMRTEFAGDYEPARLLAELTALLPAGSRIRPLPQAGI